MSSKLDKVRGCLRSNCLTIGTMAGVIGGVIFGLILRSCKDDWTEREVMYVSYVGEIFLRMLKALILPLIVPSLITAVGSLDLSLSGGASKVEETKIFATKIFANSENKDVHFNCLKYLFPNNFMTEKYLLQVRWVCARCCTTSPRRSWRSSWASSSSPPSIPAWGARTRYPL